MLAHDDPAEFWTTNTVKIRSVTFDPPDAVPVEDAEAWMVHQLPVAAEDAYPMAIAVGKRLKRTRPQARELSFLERVLRAFAGLTAECVEAGRLAATVATFDGPMRVGLRGGTAIG